VGRLIVDLILDTFDILPFDLDTARAYAELLTATRVAGRPRGVCDLQIAATASVTGRTIVTTDGRAFADLPGVAHRVLA
jgi:tRNA(fMet)-specific endonuclease VapC